LVDKRLTSASLYGRFKGAAIPLRLSVVVGRIAAQCAHPRTACTAVTQTLHGALAQHALRSLRLFMAHDAKHLFVAANVAGGRTEIDRTATDARATSGVLGWDPVQPPVPVQGVPLAH